MRLVGRTRDGDLHCLVWRSLWSTIKSTKGSRQLKKGPSLGNFHSPPPPLSSEKGQIGDKYYVTEKYEGKRYRRFQSYVKGFPLPSLMEISATQQCFSTFVLHNSSNIGLVLLVHPRRLETIFQSDPHPLHHLGRAQKKSRLFRWKVPYQGGRGAKQRLFYTQNVKNIQHVLKNLFY